LKTTRWDTAPSAMAADATPKPTLGALLLVALTAGWAEAASATLVARRLFVCAVGATKAVLHKATAPAAPIATVTARPFEAMEAKQAVD